MNFDQCGCGKVTPYASLETNTNLSVVAEPGELRGDVPKPGHTHRARRSSNCPTVRVFLLAGGTGDGAVSRRMDCILGEVGIEDGNQACPRAGDAYEGTEAMIIALSRFKVANGLEDGCAT